MELTNLLMRYRGTDAAGTTGWDEAVRLLLTMLAPVAPHIAEELWSRRLAAAGGVLALHPHRDVAVRRIPRSWPPTRSSCRSRSTASCATSCRCRPDWRATRSSALVLARPKVQANLDGREVVKVVHVDGRLVNIVVR